MNWLLSFMVSWPKAWKSRPDAAGHSAMRAGTSASARNCKADGQPVSCVEPWSLVSEHPEEPPPAARWPHLEQGTGLHAGLHACSAAHRLPSALTCGEEEAFTVPAAQGAREGPLDSQGPHSPRGSGLELWPV